MFGSISADDFIDHYGQTSAAVGATTLARLSTIITNDAAFGGSFSGLASTLSTLSSFVGTTASAFGDSSTQPATLFGFMKRVQENLEGDSTYVKGTGVWTVTDRAGLTTIATKTITDSGSTVTKA